MLVAACRYQNPSTRRTPLPHGGTQGGTRGANSQQLSEPLLVVVARHHDEQAGGGGGGGDNGDFSLDNGRQVRNTRPISSGDGGSGGRKGLQAWSESRSGVDVGAGTGVRPRPPYFLTPTCPLYFPTPTCFRCFKIYFLHVLKIAHVISSPLDPSNGPSPLPNISPKSFI
jgi:hypothetical protein